MIRRIWLELLYVLRLRDRPLPRPIHEMVIAAIRANPGRISDNVVQNSALLRHLRDANPPKRSPSPPL